MDLREQNRAHYNTMDWLRQSHKGVRLLKYKSDLDFYKQQIAKRKPDIIIETGTLRGGSALWFQDLIDGQVITIDIASQVEKKDPRILYIEQSSTDPAVIKKIKPLIKGKKVMVVLDSNHTKEHVDKEIQLYAPLVTKGQLFVVEDTMFKPYFDNQNMGNEEVYDQGSCSDSVEEWNKKGFREVKGPDISMNPGGWFECVRA